MSTKLLLQCDGCSTRVEIGPIRKTFSSFNGGRGHGFGKWHQPNIDAHVDGSGWIWSDPYTSCTYCPECWGKIERGEAAE